MNDQMAVTLKRWHEFVQTPDEQILQEILSDNARFYSPFVWKPKDKAAAIQILIVVGEVFEDFRYVRETTNINSCCLEFAAQIGQISLQGIDIIEFDQTGQIIEFKVMIRPANALQALGAEMGKRLAARGFTV